MTVTVTVSELDDGDEGIQPRPLVKPFCTYVRKYITVTFAYLTNSGSRTRREEDRSLDSDT